MASILYDPKIDGPGLVFVVGKFEGSGTGDTVDSYLGQGIASVTASGAVYTITFTDTYADLVAFVASPSANTVADVDTYVFVADEDSWSAGSKTLAVTASEGGTPTALAADEFCNFVAVFRNTSSWS